MSECDGNGITELFHLVCWCAVNFWQAQFVYAFISHSPSALMFLSVLKTRLSQQKVGVCVGGEIGLKMFF